METTLDHFFQGRVSKPSPFHVQILMSMAQGGRKASNASSAMANSGTRRPLKRTYAVSGNGIYNFLDLHT